MQPKAQNRALSEDPFGVARGGSPAKQGVIIKALDDTNAYVDDEDFNRLLIPVKSENDYSIISNNKSPLKKSIKKMTEVKLMDIRDEEKKD